MLESVQPCSELSIHLPVFFPLELYIFSSSSRLVCNTDKMYEKFKIRKKDKKYISPNLMGWLYCMAIRSNKCRNTREWAHVANADDI